MSPRLSPGVVVVVVVSFSRSFAVAALVVDVEGRCQIQAKASIRPFASNLPTHHARTTPPTHGALQAETEKLRTRHCHSLAGHWDPFCSFDLRVISP